MEPRWWVTARGEREGTAASPACRWDTAGTRWLFAGAVAVCLLGSRERHTTLRNARVSSQCGGQEKLWRGWAAEIDMGRGGARGPLPTYWPATAGCVVKRAQQLLPAGCRHGADCAARAGCSPGRTEPREPAGQPRPAERGLAAHQLRPACHLAWPISPRRGPTCLYSSIECYRRLMGISRSLLARMQMIGEGKPAHRFLLPRLVLSYGRRYKSFTDILFRTPVDARTAVATRLRDNLKG